MGLIKHVSVSGFRSISTARLSDINGVTALVGRNSSGKSNLLRALNLFFNDETDPGQNLDFESDIHAPLRRAKKRRQIQVEVLLDLPPSFKIHSSIGLKTTSSEQREILISRTWKLDAQRRVTSEYALLLNGRLVPRGPELAPMLLRLVTFRYIPNRASPATLLQTESPVLVNALAKRLSRVSADELLGRMAGAAAELLSGTERSLRKAGAPFQKLKIDTPKVLQDLLRVTGFQALDIFGANVQAAAWGYGHQAFFLYHVLREADLDYSRNFGWRQATIWALEEPEAGLHKDLEASLVQMFLEWTHQKSNRLQVLYSTHSPSFAQQCQCGYWIEAQASGTHAQRELPNALQLRAERQGVAHTAHPALAFQDRPLVVTEGRLDAMVLAHVSETLRLAPFRYLSVKSLDPDSADGVPGIVSFLRESARARTTRTRNAPLIALLDWEVSDAQLREVQVAYGPLGSVCVVRPPPDDSNPRLGPDFRGIERFYPLRAIQEVVRTRDLQVAKHPKHPTKPWSISMSQLRGAKAHLAASVCETTDTGSLQYLANILRSIERAVTRAGDSFVAVRSDGALYRQADAFSKSVREARDKPITDTAWGAQEADLILLTSLGHAVRVRIDDLPLGQSCRIGDLVPSLHGESVVAVFSSDPRSTPEFEFPKPLLGDEYEDPYPHFIAATNLGRAARICLWPAAEAPHLAPRKFLKLLKDERVIRCAKVYGESDVGLTTRSGSVIAFNALDLDLRVRAAAPTLAIRLDASDRVTSLFVLDESTRAIPAIGALRTLPAIEISKPGGRGRKLLSSDVLFVRRPLPTYADRNE
jgi:energy-coupling factor transporter ATP-binding protein EcfA2